MKMLAYRHQVLSAGLFSAVLLAIVGCSEPEMILQGERVSVLPEITVEQADAAASAEGAGLPAQVSASLVPVIGLDAGHAGGNIQLNTALSASWSASIGGAGTKVTEIAAPVVDDGRVYTVAPNGMASAFDAETGAQLWSSLFESNADDPLPGIGGGLALTAEGLVVHSGSRRLVMLNPADGTIIWSLDFDIPLRGGPTPVADDRVAVTDLDGNMMIFALADGERQWVHLGLATNTVLFGAPAPAYAGDEIVLAGAGGEVTYFDAITGELLWTDSVASLLPRTPIQNVGDVRAHPVHDGGLIFVIGQSGRFVVFSARTGLPVWERAIAGLEMPWVAGNTVFVVSVDGRLYALRRDDGAVRWVSELEDATPIDVVVAEDPPRYFGPIVAGGQVHVISKNGTLHSFNADTGIEVGVLATGVKTFTPPVAAAGRMFIMGANGELRAFQ